MTGYSSRTWSDFRLVRCRRSRSHGETSLKSSRRVMASCPAPSTSGTPVSPWFLAALILFKCRSGEGRGDATGANLYENFAESTIGKVNDMENVLPPAAEDLQEKAEAEEEEERAKEGGGDKKLGRSSECCFAVSRDGKLMSCVVSFLKI